MFQQGVKRITQDLLCFHTRNQQHIMKTAFSLTGGSLQPTAAWYLQRKQSVCTYMQVHEKRMHVERVSICPLMLWIGRLIASSPTRAAPRSWWVILYNKMDTGEKIKEWKCSFVAQPPPHHQAAPQTQWSLSTHTVLRKPCAFVARQQNDWVQRASHSVLLLKFSNASEAGCTKGEV